ncbi:MAG TPA: hypothetical protein VHC72_03955 [Bryobacteraceae bacterium]|jgi:hypothetical protein|nr:hypothetical protein [Bryobacteraceae bacterium]
MDKRLAKRHKRQVARAKAHAKTSEPDLRTPEQIEADRQASQAGGGAMNQSKLSVSSRPVRHNPAVQQGSAARTAT